MAARYLWRARGATITSSCSWRSLNFLRTYAYPEMMGGDAMRAMVVLVVLVVLATACGSSTPRCVPGASQNCPCSDGAGAQTCGRDGTFGACMRIAGGMCISSGVPDIGMATSDGGNDGSPADGGTSLDARAPRLVLLDGLRALSGTPSHAPLTGHRGERRAPPTAQSLRQFRS